MVVLLRAFTHLDAYEDSLERAGLRPYVVGGRGYWSQQQVADVCALLAAIANPLDDQALFGALASPACGVAPDTLWLLRAAAGQAPPRLAGAGARRGRRRGASWTSRSGSSRSPPASWSCCAASSRPLAALRERGPRLSLAALIEAATTETGYDLAVLMRPAGEARFANVRKLTRLAAEFEAREGRDLRGLLDFLAARAESDAEAQAATAAEGHDGVRIMTVHNAKGLEFEVVAVPDLSRSLLAGARPPLLVLGREQPPRVGMQLRRLGSASINLYDYAELCEEAKRARRRGGPAALPRRRHPRPRAPDPQRRRQARAGAGDEAGHAGGRAPGRGARRSSATPTSSVDGAAAGAASRPGGELRRRREIAVRVNLPSPERAAELRATPPRRRRRARSSARARRRWSSAGRRSSPAAPSPTPRSPPTRNAPTASTWSGCWASADRVRTSSRIAATSRQRISGRRATAARRGRSAALAAPPCTRCWSGARRTGGPSQREELARRHAVAAGLDPEATDAGSAAGAGARLARLEPSRADRRRGDAGPRRGADPARRRRHRPARLDRPPGRARGRAAAGRRLQDRPPRRRPTPPAPPPATGSSARSTRSPPPRRWASSEVEVAYVFLERPDEPVDLTPRTERRWRPGAQRLGAAIARIGAGEFPVAAPERARLGALPRLSGPRAACAPAAESRSAAASRTRRVSRRRARRGSAPSAPRRPRRARRRSR